MTSTRTGTNGAVRGRECGGKSWAGRRRRSWRSTSASAPSATSSSGRPRAYRFAATASILASPEDEDEDEDEDNNGGGTDKTSATPAELTGARREFDLAKAGMVDDQRWERWVRAVAAREVCGRLTILRRKYDAVSAHLSRAHSAAERLARTTTAAAAAVDSRSSESSRGSSDFEEEGVVGGLTTTRKAMLRCEEWPRRRQRPGGGEKALVYGGERSSDDAAAADDDNDLPGGVVLLRSFLTLTEAASTTAATHRVQPRPRSVATHSGTSQLPAGTADSDDNAATMGRRFRRHCAAQNYGPRPRPPPPPPLRLLVQLPSRPRTRSRRHFIDEAAAAPPVPPLLPLGSCRGYRRVGNGWWAPHVVATAAGAVDAAAIF